MIRSIILSVMLLSAFSAFATHPWNIDTYLVKLKLDNPIAQLSYVKKVTAKMIVTFNHNNAFSGTKIVKQIVIIPMNMVNGELIGKGKLAYHASAYDTVQNRQAKISYTITLNNNATWTLSQEIKIEKTSRSYQDAMDEYQMGDVESSKLVLVQTSYAG